MKMLLSVVRKGEAKQQKLNEVKPSLNEPLVHAPSKLTMFLCSPIWIRIFSSDAKSLYSASVAESVETIDRLVEKYSWRKAFLINNNSEERIRTVNQGRVWFDSREGDTAHSRLAGFLLTYRGSSPLNTDFLWEAAQCSFVNTEWWSYL